MADTIVEFDFAPGATLNLELYAVQSDSIVNGAGGDSGTEETNRGGTYLATVTQALSGWFKAYITVSSTTMPIGWVNLTDDTGTYTVDRIGQPRGISLAVDWTTAITESYAADGAAGTPAQLMYLIQQAITEFAISSTTKTIKKLDGSTTAATETLDDATTPTSITRAT